MIFSNRIYKISSGKNISLFANSSDKLTMYIFKNLIEEKQIDLSSTITCKNILAQHGYNKVIKLNNLHYLICFDKNTSIVENL